MNVSILGYVGLILLIGLMSGKLAAKLHVPNVTGYLLGGLIFGPSLLNVLNNEMLSSMQIISEVALAFIAFSIGLSFKRSYMKKMGLTPFVIAILEASFAVIFVFAGLLIIGTELPLAIMLSSIAAATAPAATVMIMKEYRAKGPASDMLLSVVALDDAVALILFGFAASIASVLVDGMGDHSLLMTIAEPFWDVGLSILIGAGLGALMALPFKIFKTKGNKTALFLAFVFLTTSTATYFGVSELLACMVAGGVFTNLSIESNFASDLIDNLTPPIYLMFFVVSGASLNLAVLPTIGLVGAIYVVFRVIGKVAGAYTGARLMGTKDSIRKYLGWMILPQAGVAIGLSAIAERTVPGHGETIRTIILAATFIFEMIGPVSTKIALEKAGEITTEKKRKSIEKRTTVAESSK